MTVESLHCYVGLWSDYVTLNFVVITRSGMALVVFDRYNDSEDTITISDAGLKLLRERLGISDDKITEAFQSLKLPEYCCVIPYEDIYAVCVKSKKNIDTIFGTIDLISTWWYDSINKLKPIEFPYRVLINTVIACHEIRFK